MKEGAGSITNPCDNTTYAAGTDWSSKGTQLGSSGYYCIYNGSGNTVSVTNTTPNAEYTVQVFEYNGTGGSEKYNTATESGNPNNENTMPVELISFTASSFRLHTTLTWSTATEVNNYGFEIQRSEVSSQKSESEKGRIVEWVNIGFVEGSGTSNTPKAYSFVDRNLKSDLPAGASAKAGKYQYRLKQIDHNGAFTYSKSIEAEAGVMPKEFKLFQNYPNPFNPATTIEFTVAQDGFASLKVYDMLGKEVAVLVNGDVKTGIIFQAPFNAAQYASGMYFYTLRAGNFVETKKMLLVK